MRVGFIGLGKMGLPMATNFRAAGHDLIVHNRSRAKVDAFVAEGGTAAGSPARGRRRGGGPLCQPAQA